MDKSKSVQIGPVTLGNHLPIALIAGPCQMESRAHALETATALKEICGRLGIGLIYKSSFDKANRTSATAARGLGMAAALPVFAEIRESLGLPVLTDVHDAAQCAPVAQAESPDRPAVADGARVASDALYRVTVTLAAQTARAYGEIAPLQPGMQLQADVLIETRRLYEWILDPLYSLTGRGDA